MDRHDQPASDSVARKLWHRYCPVCEMNTSAALVPVRGAYDVLLLRLLRRRAVACVACGMRLQGRVSVRSKKRWIRVVPAGPRSFMSPQDGRSPDQLLHDLKRAENGRELAEPPVAPPRLRPPSRRQ